MTTKERLQLWKRRYATWDNLWRVLLVIMMLCLAAWGLYLGWSYPDNVVRRWSYWKYSLVTLGPELAGIVIGVVFIDALNERRQNQQLKAQLIRKMGGPINDVALPAVRELAHHGWLYDGSLEGAMLEGANLEGADLENANLKGALMDYANLKGAQLHYAHLEGAKLEDATLENAYLDATHLERAFLGGTRLNGAHLGSAHLEGATFWDTVLTGTDLRWAHLEGAKILSGQQLQDAESVAGAIMPDGVRLQNLNFLIPYPDGPTLEEWLATKPDCLDWPDEEEIDPIAINEVTSMLDNLNPEDEEE